MKWTTAGWLALAAVLLMVANSADFFLHQPFYEVNDWAANSLSIHRAKHFAEAYGNYSRWGFHHPGPAFFYFQAFGEWFFYDVLHLVAAPFNGQLLVHMVMMTCLFVAVIAVFARSLPAGGGPWFVPLALGISALHFSAMADLSSDLGDSLFGPSALGSSWTAHSLVIPTLCLLAAGAAVAAGRGELLPLLAFADGCLIHLHVAQPLFVLPLTALAYLALWWQQKSPPWRSHPRAHRWALWILVVFASPIVFDLFKGDASNLSAILRHMQAFHGDHKPLIRSLFYFLHFGSYSAYSPHRSDFGHYDFPGAMSYLFRHGLYYLMWASAATLALRPLALTLARSFGQSGGNPVPDAPEPAGPAGLSTLPVPPDTQRFLVWGGVFLVADFGLTLFWGTIQDGEMYYFNAWFNYSIFHFVALLALASLCARPRREPAADPARRRPWWPVLAGTAGVLAVCAPLAKPLRVVDPNVEADHAMHAAVARALEASALPPDAARKAPSRLLVLSQPVWETSAGVALQMERAGIPFVVLPNWQVLLGEEHTWTGGHQLASDAATPLQMLHVHPRSERLLAPRPAFSLSKGGTLSILPPVIDPTREDRNVIDFSNHGNSPAYQLSGFSSASESWGIWNDGFQAFLAFHPLPAPGDVEISMDVAPFIVAKRHLTKQRLHFYFNGEEVAPERWITGHMDALTYTIPADLWAHATTRPSDVAVIEMDFPNATRPYALDPTAPARDLRYLAMAFGQMHFRPAAVPGESQKPLAASQP